MPENARRLRGSIAGGPSAGARKPAFWNRKSSARREARWPTLGL